MRISNKENFFFRRDLWSTQREQKIRNRWTKQHNLHANDPTTPHLSFSSVFFMSLKHILNETNEDIASVLKSHQGLQFFTPSNFYSDSNINISDSPSSSSDSDSPNGDRKDTMFLALIEEELGKLSPTPTNNPFPQQHVLMPPNTSKKKDWNDRFEELKDFKRKYGHCNVVRKGEYRSLGHWVHEQRRMKKKGTMPKERIDKLEMIDFMWTPSIQNTSTTQKVVKKRRFGSDEEYSPINSPPSTIHNHHPLFIPHALNHSMHSAFASRLTFMAQ